MARILRQVTVARDGWHNGFTDVQYWQDCYWVSYRKGMAHATMDGEAVVSVSTDRTRFREAARVKVRGDNRDPKLFPINGDRVAMRIPSWIGGYQSQHLHQYITFSDDGFNYEKPVRILDPGQWLWRIRERDGLYYGLVQELTQSKRDPEKKQHNLVLMTSTDLLQWDLHCRIGDDAVSLNESDIVWRGDGEAWIVARSTVPPSYSFFCSAPPPWKEWEITRLDAMIHAAIMLEHEGELYVTGRSSPELEGVTTFPFLSQSSLGLWRVTRGAVEPVLRIPATGDCSYPGLIKDPEGRICLSYYSQHAYDMGVVPRPCRLKADRTQASGEILNADDVYFAELELP